MGRFPACRAATTGPHGPLRPKLGLAYSPEHGRAQPRRRQMRQPGRAGSIGGEAPRGGHQKQEGPLGVHFAELGPWVLTLLGRDVGALGSGGSGVEALLQRRGLASTCTGEFMDGSCMSEPRPLEEIQRGVRRSVVLTERWWSRGWRR
jgi:hypothetical protein